MTRRFGTLLLELLGCTGYLVEGVGNLLRTPLEPKGGREGGNIRGDKELGREGGKEMREKRKKNLPVGIS